MSPIITSLSCLRFAKHPEVFDSSIDYYTEVQLSNHAHWTFNLPLSYVPAVSVLVTNLGDAKVCSNADLALDIA